MEEQNFQFKLNNFQSNVLQSFSFMRNETVFQDVTLVTDDLYHVRANKVILSASSEYFRDILMKVNHPNPLLCLEGVGLEVLNNILDYIHCGEILIPQKGISEFLKCSQRFKLEGVLGVSYSNTIVKEERNFVSDSQERVKPFVKSKKTKIFHKLPQKGPGKERINSAVSIHQEFIPVATEHPKTKEIVASRKCKHCDQIITGSNPTNLRRHLCSFHPDVFMKVQAQDEAFKSVKLRSVTHLKSEDDNAILEEDEIRHGESGSVEVADQELEMVMDETNVEEISKLEPDNQECVQELLIGDQSQLDSPSKYLDLKIRKPSNAHREFLPVEMEHPYTNEKIEGRKCKHCQTVIRGKNPTNLNRHLISFHPAVYQKTYHDNQQ